MNKQIAQNILKIFVFVFLWSMAFEHLFWDAFRVTRLYNESLFRFFFGNILHVVPTDPYLRIYLLRFVRIIGVFYLFYGLMVFFSNRLKKWSFIIWLSVPLVLLRPFLNSILNLSQFLHFNLIMEYSIQAFSFVYLFYIVNGKSTERSSSRMLFLGKLLVGATFVGHAMYAINVIPTPDSFIIMTERLLGFSENRSYQFLLLVGILDIAAALLLFVPHKGIQLAALWYCIAWGFATALARICAFYNPHLMHDSLIYWLPETTLRLVHGAFPLFLYLFYFKKET